MLKLKTCLLLSLVVLLSVSLVWANEVKEQDPAHLWQQNDVAPNAGPVLYPPMDAQWDMMFYTQAGDSANDFQMLGVEFVGDYFWATGGASGTDPNILYKYDRLGNLVGQWNQPAASTGWGMRDLAWDGTLLWGSEGFDMFSFDPATNMWGATFTGPSSPCRALAYDPATGHFWTQSFSGPIYEFDNTGTVIWTGTSGVTGAYGMAWDDQDPAGGPWLWIHDQSGPTITHETTIYQYDPVAHTLTGVSYLVPLVPGCTEQVAGGLAFTDEYDPQYWTMLGMTQGTPSDHIFVLEMYDAAHTDAPAAASPFTVSDNGATLQASLAWTNPTTTVSGGVLSSIDTVIVNRGGSFLTSFTGVTPGQVMTHDDATMTSAGQYDYEVICVNDSGRGIPANAGAWIGLDTPGPVTSLTGAGVGILLEANIDWVNPTVGAHGGYWPAGSIDGYTIDRIGPSNATFTPTGILTSFYDNTIPLAGWYTYEVTPNNSSGNGPTVATASFYVGRPEFESIPFAWVEINPARPGALPGTNTGIVNDDQILGPFAMGINFPFYDCDFFSQIKICSNGWMTFNIAETGTHLGNDPIPSTVAPNLTIAPYWDDMRPGTSPYYAYHGEIYYYHDAANDRFIVEYDSVSRYGSSYLPNEYTHETIFYADGTIDYMYKVINPGTYPSHPSASVGIENSTGTVGIQCTYNGSGPIEPANSTGIRIHPVCDPEDYCVELTPDVLTSIVAPGGLFDYALTATNCGDSTEVWDVTATVVAGQPWLVEIWNTAMTIQIDSIGPLVWLASDSFIVRQLVPPGATTGQSSTIEIIVDGRYGTDQNVLADTSYATTTAVDVVTLPYFEDFDSSNGGYSSVGTGCWEWGAPTYTGTGAPDSACSEPYCWGTVLASTYPTNACCSLYTPPVVLTGPAELSFCHYYYIEGWGYDGGNVKISIDGGTTWNALTPTGGYPGTTNTAPACIQSEPAYLGYPGGAIWTTATFDLTPYAGNTAIISWVFASDGSVVYPGWYIDNVRIDAPEQWCVDVEPETQINVINAGDTTDFNLTLENCGLNPDTWDMSVANVPTGWTALVMDAAATTVIDSIGPVASGVTVNFVCRLVSPSTAVGGTYTVDVIADSRYGTFRTPLADTVQVSAFLCPTAFTLPYLETFDWGGVDPPCWTIIDGGSLTGPPGRWHGELNTGTDYYMITDSDGEGSAGTQDEELISPTIDCSGIPVVFLEYWHLFDQYATSVGAVDVSISGGAWQNVISYTADITGYATHNISAWAANQSDVRIRFHYTAAWDWWWLIDSVAVYAGALTYDAATTCIRVTPITTGVNDGARKVSGASYDAYATVENVGSGSGNVTVNGSDNLGWTSSTTITGMAGGTCQEVMFPTPWIGGPAGALNTMTVTTVMVNDTSAGNDTNMKSVTVPGVDGDTLIVDDGGTIANAVYWQDIYPGNQVANSFTPTSYPAQINWVSHRILGPGDPYYPWPDPTFDQFSVSIWLEDPLNPGFPAEPPVWSEWNMYPSSAAGAWTMVTPDVPVTITSGSFWVGIENFPNCASPGYEPICIDGVFDYPLQSWQRAAGVWSLLTGLGGDLMIRANLSGAVPPVVDLVIWLVDTDERVSAVLDWSTVTGAAEYKIYKSTTSPTSGYTCVDSTTLTQWTDASAVANNVNSYYYVTVDNVLDSPVTAASRITPAVGPVARYHGSPLLIDRYQQRQSAHPGTITSVLDSQTQNRDGSQKENTRSK